MLGMVCKTFNAVDKFLPVDTFADFNGKVPAASGQKDIQFFFPFP